MKKITLAVAMLAVMGLSACTSQQQDDNSYHGTVLFSQYEGDNLKLTIRKDDCDADKRATAQEDQVITQKYDSDIVVGACVKVSENKENGASSSDNVSRSVSRSWLSRTGIFH